MENRKWNFAPYCLLIILAGCTMQVNRKNNSEDLKMIQQFMDPFFESVISGDYKSAANYFTTSLNKDTIEKMFFDLESDYGRLQARTLEKSEVQFQGVNGNEHLMAKLIYLTRFDTASFKTQVDVKTIDGDLRIVSYFVLTDYYDAEVHQ